MSSYFITD